MKISAIETRARSLANLSNTEAISHDDVDSSSNEAWKDIYARLLESDDDYWVQIQTFTSITAYATTNPNEYLIPLPTDFYKLRGVDWQGGKWREMHKFAMSLRDEEPSEPHYRFDGTSLWVIGDNVTQVRIRYYPPPAVLTHPAPTLDFCTALTPAVQNTVTLPFYIDSVQGMLYVKGNDIVFESLTAISTTTLLTGVTPTRPTYYKGYLYYIQAADIKRGVFNPSIPAAVVGAAITALATVVSFTIFDNLIYYSTAAGTFTCNLDGTGITLIAALAIDDICLLGDGPTAVLVGRVVATDTVISLTSPSIATNVMHLTSDRTYLYTIDTSLVVHRLTVSVVGTNVTVTSTDVLHPDASYIGNTDGGYLAMIDEETTGVWAFSTELDSDITYPSNTLTEILAFQMAIDFKTKFNEDFTQLKIRLGDPQSNTGLWATFNKLAKRDEYEPERIKNSRATMGSWM